MHLPDDGFYQVNYRFEGTSVPTGAEATLGLFVDPPEDVAVVADEMRTAFEATILTALVTTITLKEVFVRQGPDADGPSAIASSGVAGSHIGSGSSPNTAYLVRKNTGLGGRKNRGRWYIPGVDEDKVNASGEIAGAWITTLQGVVDDFIAALAAGPIGLAVVLHTLVPGPSQPTPTPITSMSVEGSVATQRRRLRR